jgi:hypothetical protein
VKIRRLRTAHLVDTRVAEPRWDGNASADRITTKARWTVAFTRQREFARRTDQATNRFICRQNRIRSAHADIVIVENLVWSALKICVQQTAGSDNQNTQPKQNGTQDLDYPQCNSVDVVKNGIPLGHESIDDGNRFGWKIHELQPDAVGLRALQRGVFSNPAHDSRNFKRLGLIG